MDYKEFAKQLRNQAGNYALFYGAPRGDLEKAADVIEELAAKLEPSSTPLTLDELRRLYIRMLHDGWRISGLGKCAAKRRPNILLWCEW